MEAADGWQRRAAGWNVMGLAFHDDPDPLREELAAALRECQSVLALMAGPREAQAGVSSGAGWAMCVAAETRARRVLGKVAEEAR